MPLISELRDLTVVACLQKTQNYIGNLLVHEYLNDLPARHAFGSNTICKKYSLYMEIHQNIDSNISIEKIEVFIKNLNNYNI